MNLIEGLITIILLLKLAEGGTWVFLILLFYLIHIL